MERIGSTPEAGGGQFDVDSYLQERAARTDFVMVEIGHGAKPAAYADPEDFNGGRTYIGIEAWRRDQMHLRRDMIDRTYLRHAGWNIFFIDRSQARESDRESTSAILPDGSADELLVANVLGDPDVCGDTQSLRRMIKEFRRLLAPDGRLVLRETVTPPMWIVLKDFLRESDLETEAVIHMDTPECWAQLESVYGGGGMRIYVNPNSYYLIAR
jgi:hypothetical protein